MQSLNPNHMLGTGTNAIHHMTGTEAIPIIRRAEGLMQSITLRRLMQFLNPNHMSGTNEIHHMSGTGTNAIHHMSGKGTNAIHHYVGERD